MELVTASEAEALQRGSAGSLSAAGCGAGDRVAVVASPSAQVAAFALGALRVGVVPVMINPALTADERAALVADSGAALVVDDRSVAEAVRGDPATPLAPWPRARPMHYTSGTGGAPKGVWSGILDDDSAAELVADETAAWGIDAADVHLVCAPLAHSAPLRFALTTWMAGGSVVVLPRFDPAIVTAAISRHRPTSAFVAPVHLQRLLAHWSVAPADLSCFRLVAHAGSACPPDVKAAAVERFPAGSVFEFYGSTEGQFTVASPDDWARRPGSVGRARPGREMRADREGVLWCRPPSFARFEYWRDPVKTAAAWRDGWFTVGDLGRVDDDGFVFLDGRRDDLIISGAVNVYPAEVEAVLSRCPGVVEVAVFGVDDQSWGQRVCAAVVGSAKSEDVTAFAAIHLAGYKRPKQIVVVDALPRTATGKIQRFRLAHLLV